MGSGSSTDSNNNNTKPTTYETGVKCEELTITWRINNFRPIFENESLINSQEVNFIAGSTIGIPSNWQLFLQVGRTADSAKWVGVYYKVVDSSSYDKLYSKFSASIIDNDGDIVWRGSTKITNMCNPQQSQGWGFGRVISETSDLSFLVDEALVIRVNFFLYALAAQTQYFTHETDVKVDSDSEEPPSKKLKNDTDADSEADSDIDTDTKDDNTSKK